MELLYRTKSGISTRIGQGSKPKKNILPWRSEQRIGLRANWLKLVLALLLLMENDIYHEMPAHQKGSGWVAVLLVVLLLLLYSWYYRERDSDVLVIGIVALVLVAALLVAGTLLELISWRNIGYGVLNVSLGLTLAGITLTTWWPPFRPCENWKG